MSLQLHRPDGQGGLERRQVEDQNWRRQLRSVRWGQSLPGNQLPALRNTEMNPTPTAISIGFWLGLAALTFVLLLVGYGTGFWH
ncbi:MAG TPA: hypothetical protein VFS32_08990 [Candidatus Limnocylindrales bacterium]|nr:hypothetical protein [Candidatus Limnocylindrales bacterium]